MRRPLYATAVCAALAASAAIFWSGAQAAEPTSGGHCLRFKDLKSLTKIDDRTLLATTNSSEKYKVNLRSECRDFGRPDNYYTVRLHSEWECIDRDDVLEFKMGGVCFIDSVTLVPDKKPG